MTYPTAFRAANRSPRPTVLAAAILVVAHALPAATNAPTNPSEIPPLRPPKPEVFPGFWEEHAVWVIAASLVALGAIVLLLRWWLKPKPATPDPPATRARQALSALEGRPQTMELLGEVSRILRQYFVAAYALPTREHTNSELCRALDAHPTADKALAEAASTLLQGMEERRFGTGPNETKSGVVQTAMGLIEQAEECLKPKAAETVGTDAAP